LGDGLWHLAQPHFTNPGSDGPRRNNHHLAALLPQHGYLIAKPIDNSQVNSAAAGEHRAPHLYDYSPPTICHFFAFLRNHQYAHHNLGCQVSGVRFQEKNIEVETSSAGKAIET
jgi:hypothetical protein